MYSKLGETYNGKKVLITGHTGFKGAWLSKILAMLGANIAGYALPPLNEDGLFNLLSGTEFCNSVIGNILDRESLFEMVVKFQPDFLFHLAAQPLVKLSYEIPSSTFEVNVIGSANVLDAVRLLNNSCQVIMVTTDKVYHNYEWVYPYRETDRLGGYDPYSASKACAELLIDSYRNSFFNLARYNEHLKSIAVARAGNVIGGGDWSKDRLMPDIARALLAGDEIQIRNPISVRPWQHVLEPLGGYLLLGERMLNDPIVFSQAYNFGPVTEDSLDVESVVTTAVSCWGHGSSKSYYSADASHEAATLKLDINKAVSSIGWRPRFSAKQAITLTMDWYRKYHEQRSGIGEFTESQIQSFLNG